MAGSFSNVVYSQVFHGAAGVMMISITCDGYILDCLALISCTSTTLSAIKLHCTTIIIGRVICIMIFIKWPRRALTTSTHNLWTSESIINYQLLINYHLIFIKCRALPTSTLSLRTSESRLERTSPSLAMSTTEVAKTKTHNLFHKCQLTAN